MGEAVEAPSTSSKTMVRIVLLLFSLDEFSPNVASNMEESEKFNAKDAFILACLTAGTAPLVRSAWDRSSAQGVIAYLGY